MGTLRERIQILFENKPKQKNIFLYYVQIIFQIYAKHKSTLLSLYEICEDIKIHALLNIMPIKGDITRGNKNII